MRFRFRCIFIHIQHSYHLCAIILFLYIYIINILVCKNVHNCYGNKTAIVGNNIIDNIKLIMIIIIIKILLFIYYYIYHVCGTHARTETHIPHTQRQIELINHYHFFSFYFFFSDVHQHIVLFVCAMSRWNDYFFSFFISLFLSHMTRFPLCKHRSIIVYHYYHYYIVFIMYNIHLII